VHSVLVRACFLGPFLYLFPHTVSAALQYAATSDLWAQGLAVAPLCRVLGRHLPAPAFGCQQELTQ